jgi:hypothetical protein
MEKYFDIKKPEDKKPKKKVPKKDIDLEGLEEDEVIEFGKMSGPQEEIESSQENLSEEEIEAQKTDELLRRFVSNGETPEPQKKSKKSKKFPVWIPIILVLFGGFYFLSNAFSNVTIEVITDVATSTHELDIEFNEKGGNNALPLYYYDTDFNYSNTYEATGVKEGGISKASGEIIVYNEFSKEPQVLIATTRFESPEGLIFRTTQRITIPGYTLDENGKIIPGTTTVSVIADGEGENYNLEPTKFTIPAFKSSPRYDKIYGISTRKFEGGGSTQVKFITSQDIAAARGKIAEYAYEKAKEEITSQMPIDMKLLDQASKIQIDKIEVKAKEGEERSSFEATISGTFSILVFDERDIKKYLADKELTPLVSNDLFSTQYQLTYSNPQISFENRTLSLHLKVNEIVVPNVDTLTFKQSIAGKDIDTLKTEILKLQGIKEVNVSIWPFWLKNLPTNLDRISIKLTNF